MRRVGHDWGVAITEGMGDAIAEDAERLFGGDRQAAEIFNIGQIIGAADGLSTDNIQQFQARLRDVFVELETGAFSAAQATRVLDENFGDFAEFFEGGLISRELREMVALTREFGLESRAVTGFLREQASLAESGLEGILAGALPRTEREGELEFTRPVDQTEFDRLSRLTAAAFDASRASGMGFLETLTALDDEIDLLSDAAAEFGLSQVGAFGNLAGIQTFFEANEGLAASIQGTDAMLRALANSNLLTQESFDDLAATAVENFGRMVAGGLSVDQALMAQQETLQTLWELMQEGTLVVDEQTQALIDQAVEAGRVGEEHMDAQERATRAMEEAARAMERVGTILGEVFGIAGDDSEAFVDRALTAIDQLPREVQFVYRGIYSPPDMPGDAPSVPADLPSFSAGTRGQYVDFGPGTLAKLHGRERIMTAAEGAAEGALSDEVRGLRRDLQVQAVAVQRLFDTLPDQFAAVAQMVRGQGLSHA